MEDRLIKRLLRFVLAGAKCKLGQKTGLFKVCNSCTWQYRRRSSYRTVSSWYKTSSLPIRMSVVSRSRRTEYQLSSDEGPDRGRNVDVFIISVVYEIKCYDGWTVSLVQCHRLQKLQNFKSSPLSGLPCTCGRNRYDIRLCWWMADVSRWPVKRQQITADLHNVWWRGGHNK